MELLRMSGEGVQIGDMPADELVRMAGKPAFSLRLPDDRVVVVIGLTRDEARACVPGFMATARFTVSTAMELEKYRPTMMRGVLHSWAADAQDEIERLRGLLHRQYRADAVLYGMPNDCTEEQHREAITEHDAVHLLLIAEFVADSKLATSESRVT